MQIAEKRLRGAFANFRSRGHMFEKYDSSSLRRTGGGGEYDVQVGVSNVWKNSIYVSNSALFNRLDTLPTQKRRWKRGIIIGKEGRRPTPG